MDKDKPSEIPVARYEYTVLVARDAQQFNILCLRQAKVGRAHDIVSQSSQKPRGDGINILIQKQLHPITAM